MTVARRAMRSKTQAIFAVPVGNDYLLYSPLHGLVATVNPAALVAIKDGLEHGRVSPTVRPIVEVLGSPGCSPPTPPNGPVEDPLFLGLVTTRGCNMACRYCAFLDVEGAAPMSIQTAQSSIDAYFALLAEAGRRSAEIHFFGGEPLVARGIVEFAVGYAKLKASDGGFTLHLEISTNGLLSESRAVWLGDHFDTVVLSMDGTASAHDRNRPTKRLRGTYEAVAQTARVLSESAAELWIRTCTTSNSLAQMREWVATIAEDLQPEGVCFERLSPTPQSAAAGLQPPDARIFACEFRWASHALGARGIAAVTSTTDLGCTTFSCCPVGRDALIVTPDGRINACYLLESQWQDKGIDLEVGSVHTSPSRFWIDPDSVARVRKLAAAKAHRCQGCVCVFHCAGGCHVDHEPLHPADTYDDLCSSTRLITLAQLLDRVGPSDQADLWLAGDAAGDWSSLGGSDLLEDVHL